MIVFTNNGEILFNLDWLVDPTTWTGRIALSIGIPVATKIFLQTDFYRNNSPFSKWFNIRTRAEIESTLIHNLPASDPMQKIQAFPKLSSESILKLDENGFLQITDPKDCFHISILATSKTYRIFKTEQLGAGAFGEAFLGQDLETGEWVAVKKHPADSVAREQNVLIENRYLLSDKKLLGQAIYEENNRNYLVSVMPLYVKNSPERYSSHEKIEFLIAVAQELKRLHQKNKIHSDLHLGNVCWNRAKGVANLIDYGSIIDAGVIQDTSSYHVPKLYMPPESFFGLGLLHVKAGDIYSLGCMAKRLFPNSNNTRLNFLIQRMQKTFFFMRPSLDTIISELSNILDNFQEIIEDINLERHMDENLVKVKEEIKHCQALLNVFDCRLSQLKSECITQPNYIELALLTKERSIYDNYLSSLNSSISLFQQYQIEIKLDEKQFELQKNLKELIKCRNTIVPNYQLLDNICVDLQALDHDEKFGEENPFALGGKNILHSMMHLLPRDPNPELVRAIINATQTNVKLIRNKGR